MSWVAPFLVIWRVLRSRRVSCVWAPSGKQRTETSWALRSPRWAPATVFWAAGRSALFSSHRTMSCRSAPPGARPRRLARCRPHGDLAGLRSNAEETPISAPSSPRPAVATAPEPAPPHRPLGRRQAAAPRPCLCPHLPASRTHAALPASPSLVLPASLTPLDADCLFLPSRGPHGDQCLPAPPPPVQCHAGTAPGGPAASSPQKSLAPARRAPGDAPRHCALVPLSCPRGSGGRGAGPGAAPAPSPEWVTVGEVAAGDPAE